MLNTFRAVSLLEGCSYLLVLGVSLGVISRDHVFVLGMTHGLLFFAYLVCSLVASHRQIWSMGMWLLVFLASLVPFAFIAVEVFLRREIQQPHSPVLRNAQKTLRHAH